MIEMQLQKIIIDEKRHDQVVVLKEKNGKRILPIIIGITEASSIKMKISGFEPPRPLTHDLLKATIENLEANVDKVVIDKLESNTFHAKLILRMGGNGKIKDVDARPSDAIALAVRANSPIFVEEEVLRQTEIFNKDHLGK